MMRRVKGKADVHYCAEIEAPQPKTLCGVACGDFLVTNDRVNCPECHARIDERLGAVRELLPA